MEPAVMAAPHGTAWDEMESPHYLSNAMILASGPKRKAEAQVVLHEDQEGIMGERKATSWSDATELRAGDTKWQQPPGDTYLNQLSFPH